MNREEQWIFQLGVRWGIDVKQTHTVITLWQAHTHTSLMAAAALADQHKTLPGVPISCQPGGIRQANIAASPGVTGCTCGAAAADACCQLLPLPPLPLLSLLLSPAAQPLLLSPGLAVIEPRPSAAAYLSIVAFSSALNTCTAGCCFKLSQRM